MTRHKAYVDSGVNIDAGNRATKLMAQAVRSTYGAEVLAEIGAFGGLYDAAALKQMAAPVLVASTDGVGTKTKVAARLGRWGTIGQDLVNHCVNDILVQGAQPLFFLDYVASSRLDPEQVAAVVGGVAQACREIGCALLGGETAEMPGVYESGEIDLAGTIIGVVERARIIDGSNIRTGDVILALPSSGLHTNGYSLAREVLADLDWNDRLPELDGSVGDALLSIHRAYFKPVKQLRDAGIEIRGMAHITGGGVIENLPRILPSGVGAVIQRGTWAEPPIFGLIQRLGAIPDAEMFHVFNMGLGMVVVMMRDQASAAQRILPETTVVGEIMSGAGIVSIR
jgi:phosphoribosylformylglycinamidine cyclo-ligase